MQSHDAYTATAELKFLDGEPEGTFGGLGSVFGNQDSHGDVMLPGAFAASLAQHKASGTMPGMFVEHSKWVGGDPLPIGVWQSMDEGAGGLNVKGRLIGMAHPDISRVADLMRAGALGGLSIAFSPAPGGVSLGKKAGEPKRTLKAVKLFSVDVVADPSNKQARVTSMKSVGDERAALEALAEAMAKLREAITGELKSNEMTRLLEDVQTAQMAAHMALTGEPVPADMKAMPTLREFQDSIRMMWGLSNSSAREITERGFKSSQAPRDEGSDPVTVADTEAAKAFRDELGGSLTGFTLPSF